MRPIDADELKNKLLIHMDAFIDADNGRLMYSDHLIDNADYIELCKFIDTFPTIEPRKGKWVWKIGMVKCDQCLRAIRRIDCDGLLNFCPNCGAKMEEKSDERFDDFS